MDPAAVSRCKKFQANIFNKSKCQNCFRPKEHHTAEALESSKVRRGKGRGGGGRGGGERGGGGGRRGKGGGGGGQERGGGIVLTCRGGGGRCVCMYVGVGWGGGGECSVVSLVGWGLGEGGVPISDIQINKLKLNPKRG